MPGPVVFLSDPDGGGFPAPALATLAGRAEIRLNRASDPGAGEALVAAARDAVVIIAHPGLTVDAPALAALPALVALVWPAGEPGLSGLDLAAATELGVLVVRAAASPGAVIGQLNDILAGSLPDGAVNPDRAPRLRRLLAPLPPETGGAAGPEPTRYGDWQHKGRVTDF